jgi:hypothetical protein
MNRKYMNLLRPSLETLIGPERPPKIIMCIRTCPSSYPCHTAALTQTKSRIRGTQVLGVELRAWGPETSILPRSSRFLLFCLCTMAYSERVERARPGACVLLRERDTDND